MGMIEHELLPLAAVQGQPSLRSSQRCTAPAAHLQHAEDCLWQGLAPHRLAHAPQQCHQPLQLLLVLSIQLAELPC